LTFAATANAVVYVGANPVFVDADPATWQIDPQLVLDELDRRAAASALPAAVITVDLYGQCADHDPIASRCRELGIPLIEDAAEALGATYRGRPAGSLGDIGVFSFNGNKVITTSGGGMLVTESEEQAARARFLATQARDAAAHYEHSVVGYNYRLSNLLAALGVAQMSHLSDHVDRRREHNHIYRESLDALPGVAFMPAASYGVASWWLTALTIDPAVAPVGRDDVIAALADIGIEARPVWKPMHRQPVFRDRATLGGAVSEAIFNDGLCLPSGSSLTDDERAEVISCVRQVVGGAAGSLRRQGLGLS
jgi:dTDP-4-amino-4,6-dideoxygalactose transaminase